MSRVVVVDFAPRLWVAAWQRHEALHPFLTGLERLIGESDWPDVARYRALLGADVDFAAPLTRLPAGLDSSDIDDSYIGRCVRGCVPTRARNLHDLMNALTWAAFPRSKRALCARQVEVAIARGTMTNRVRIPAQDRLAMLDEGGVLVLANDDSGATAGATVGATVTFGHGLLEDLILGRASRGFPLSVASFADDTVAAALMALALPPDVAVGPTRL